MKDKSVNALWRANSISTLGKDKNVFLDCMDVSMPCGGLTPFLPKW